MIPFIVFSISVLVLGWMSGIEEGQLMWVDAIALITFTGSTIALLWKGVVWIIGDLKRQNRLCRPDPMRDWRTIRRN